MLIYVKSPTGKKIPVGKTVGDEAVFRITKERIFREADAIGIDKAVADDWNVKSKKFIIFTVEDDRSYRLTMDDFLLLAWEYPKKDDPNYKANNRVFKPKMVVAREVLAKYHKPMTEEERAKYEYMDMNSL